MMDISGESEYYKKAIRMEEVDNAVRFDVPVDDKHPFFTDFSHLRGTFEERVLFRALNINPKNLTYNRANNIYNKSLVFLAGMRGSGKTTELAKISAKLHNPDAFFCITCNLDTGLDTNDMEYMDILVFQVERLLTELKDCSVDADEDILQSLENWFSEKVTEVNTAIKREGGFEMEVSAGASGLLRILGFTSRLKANLQGSKENATKIRTVFRTNFTDFSRKLNEFFEHVNMKLREKHLAQEILFIIDGMEKVATSDLRKKIVVDENDRIRQIKANTIFTLPIELMAETQRIAQMNTVLAFPFIKVREKDGSVIQSAMEKFREFVAKRIDAALFDTPETIDQAILYSGGSPRELLRILEYANLHATDEQITREALEKGLKKMAAQTAQYITVEDFLKLKMLSEDNKQGLETAVDASWQALIEQNIVFEYNDGTYKRVNPVVELSGLYKRYVG